MEMKKINWASQYVTSKIEYEDNIQQILEKYHDLFEYSTPVLSCDYGVCDIFIFHDQLIILN